MEPINYYPFINQGHTFKMAVDIDPERLYIRGVIFELAPILIASDFPKPFPPDLINGEFLLFSANNIFDFNVLTSLN